MTQKLYFVHETDSARLYQNRDGAQQWVPKSVCKSVLKHAAREGELPIHEVEMADWWANKNPWPEGGQRGFGI